MDVGVFGPKRHPRSGMQRALRQAGARNARIVPPPRRCPQLHEEIVRFAEQLRETEDEVLRREATVARANMVLQTVHPGSRVHIFGSVATGLRLPYGDVDLMLEVDTPNRLRVLSRVAQALRDAAVPSALLTIPHARGVLPSSRSPDLWLPGPPHQPVPTASLTQRWLATRHRSPHYQVDGRRDGRQGRRVHQ